MNNNQIHLKLVKSALDTVKNDYTAIVVANETIRIDALIKQAVAEEPNLSETSIKLAFDRWMRMIVESLAEGKYVNFGGFGLEVYVEGSLEHMDEDVSSDRLGIQVTIYDNAFTQALAGLVPTTDVDPEALPFEFNKVEDETTNKLGVMTSGGIVKFLGDRLSCGLEGERIEIKDAAHVTHVIEDATSANDGMWLKATAPAALAKGKATVTLFSRGKNTPEAEPTPIAKQVTVIAGLKPVGPKPRVLTIKDSSGTEEGPNTVKMNYDLIFMGENLGAVSKVHFDYKREDGSTAAHDVTGELITASDTQLTLSDAFWMEMGDAKRGSEIKATLSTDDGLSDDWNFNIV